MTNMKKRIAATLTVAILTTVLTVPAMATETPDKSILVSSYKGSTLEVGERSGLIIGPSGMEYTVISSDPDTVAVEQVLTFSPKRRGARRLPPPTTLESAEP